MKGCVREFIGQWTFICNLIKPKKIDALFHAKLFLANITYLRTKMLLRFTAFIFCLLLFVTQKVQAQCSISLTGIPCVGNSLTFDHSATNATSTQWDFDHQGTSIQKTAAYVFNTPGIKKIYLKVTYPNSSTCNDTLEIEVFDLPEIKSLLISPDSQCLTQNEFCFVDSTAYGNCIKNIRYLFDDGELITRTNPSGEVKFCKVFNGANDMSMNYTVEVVNCNNCVKTFRPSRTLTIRKPRTISFTSNMPNGCDTVTAYFVNTSQINLSDVQKFLWDFGDGSYDSTHWGDGGLSHLYNKRGPANDAFTVRLKVWQKGGCVEEFVMNNAAINTLSPTGIDNVIKYYCPNDLLEPSPKGNKPPGMTFTWKLTGTGNTPWIYPNEESPVIVLSNLGAYRLVLETNHPTCPKKEFSDTFFVVGPKVKIEEIDSGYLIAQNERYQCVSSDTVHFPNRTRYYLNDKNSANDDSTVLLPSGVKHWVFDNNLNPLISKKQERKDDNIDRLWNFGDAFAPQCTTITALNINVNKNCNYSKDRYPTHFYTPWDSVYKQFYYNPNVSFTYLDFLPNGDCNIRQVDTNELELHRKLFFRRIPECYEAILTETDTSQDYVCPGTDKVRLAIQRTDISNLEVQGSGCVTPENTNINLRAFFGKTKPGCSFNMILFNPNVTRDSSNWKPFISEPPNNGYEYTGFFTPNVFYTYDSSVYNIKDDTLTVGFIVANGIGNNVCLDTLYIKNPFKVERVQSFFNIIAPQTKPTKVCVGDTILFGENNVHRLFAESSQSIEWSISGPLPSDPNVRGNLGFISEQRKNGLKHPNPDSSHLFVDMLYIYNSMASKPYDTIMLNEIFDYDLSMEITDAANGMLFQQWTDLGLPSIEYSKERVVRMFWNGVGVMGNAMTGAIGCIDTTGLSQFIDIKIIPKPNGKRTLNFRDTSILPLLNHQLNNKTYNNTYSFVPKRNGTYDIALTVSNSKNCSATSLQSFVVGFSSKISSTDSIICADETIYLKPQFRYYKSGGSAGALDSTDYWELHKNNAGKPGFEGETKIDWSMEDDDISNPTTIFGIDPYGHIGYDTAYVMGGEDGGKIYYRTPGKYTMRITTTDNSGCADTLTQNVYVIDNTAKFSLNIQDLNCRTIIELFDSSSLTDVYDSLLGSPSHSKYSWTIQWGDGSENWFSPTLPPQIGHQYKGFGNYLVTMIAATKGELNGRKPMCTDSFELNLNIPGPQPYFEPLDTLVICLGDSVRFVNKSYNPTKYAQFIWNMGDSTFITSSGGDTVTHTYKKAGIYSVFLLESDSLSGTIHYCSHTYPDTPMQQEIKVLVLDFYNAELTQDKHSICIGDSVTFTARNLQSALGYRWQVAEDSFEMITLDSVFTYTFLKNGQFSISVYPVLDSALLGVQCSYNFATVVYVDSILADFEVDSTNIPSVCFKNTSVNSAKNYWGFYHQSDITQSGNAFRLNKEINEAEFCLDYPDSVGYYWACLVAESPVGCLDTICKRIRYYSKKKLFIPNVFTPGSDSYNDFYYIDIEGQDYYELRIYNRWGDIVFQSENKDYQWNGNVENGNTECPDGTYIYQFRYRFEKDKETEFTSGVITLIREKRR